MSSFNYPENCNEPTHSTQLYEHLYIFSHFTLCWYFCMMMMINNIHSSFDESLICPNFISSPSLSNHGSNKSVKSNGATDDVVEATSHMQSGCFMVYNIYTFILNLHSISIVRNSGNQQISKMWYVYVYTVCSIQIVLKLEVDDKGEMSEYNNIPIEWNYASLSKYNDYISWRSNKIHIEGT